MTLFLSSLYPPTMSLSPTPTISSASNSHFSSAVSESSTEPPSPGYLSPSTPHISKTPSPMVFTRSKPPWTFETYGSTLFSMIELCGVVEVWTSKDGGGRKQAYGFLWVFLFRSAFGEEFNLSLKRRWRGCVLLAGVKPVFYATAWPNLNSWIKCVETVIEKKKKKRGRIRQCCIACCCLLSTT